MQRKENNALPFSYRLLGVALFALCLLLLLWVAGHVHPDFATASSPTQSASGTAAASAPGTPRTAEADLAGRFEQFVNNDVHAHALEDLTYIERHYSIPESALIAPKPDPARFGETDDPAVVQAVVESAAALLGDQALAWNPDIAFMPGSTIKYYCDDTILAIAWKEALGNSAVSFGEIKVADGSQIRRYIIALNGDFYAFRKIGITVHARQLYRNAGKTLDTCFVTAGGDLIYAHRGELDSDESVRRFIEENNVVFSLSFGPILVENGELKSAESYGSYPIGEINNIYSRSGIGQLGKLHYLIATLGEQGPYNTRAQLYTFAGYLAAKGCESAYALDGGQTATMILNGSTFNRVDWDSERTMSDIIYFATAKDSGEGVGA